MMEKLIIKVGWFLVFFALPAAGGWAIMSYNKYSFWGITWGVFIILFSWCASMTGRDKEK